MVAAAVRILAAFLATTAAYAGLVLVFGDVNPARPTTDVVRALRGYRYVPPESANRVSTFRLLITATGVDPTEHHLNATASFVYSKYKDFPLLVDDSRRAIEDFGTIKKKFADLKMAILITNVRTGTNISVAYPLSKLFSSESADGTGTVRFSLPTEAAPQDFPNDSYALKLSVAIILPDSIWTPPYPAEPPANPEAPAVPASTTVANTVPVIVGFAQSDQLAQWDVITDQVVTEGDEQANSKPISATVVRIWPYWIFVYSVSLTPVVLGLAFYARTRMIHTEGRVDDAAAIEVAAGLIALLALRQVFVPAAISGLTRLDLLLGIQILGACLIMANIYVRAPRQANDLPRKPTIRARVPRRSTQHKPRRLIPLTPAGVVPRRPNEVQARDT